MVYGYVPLGDMLRLTSDQLDEAVDLLRAGGVVVYPTETSYGIGCDGTNDEAIRRIFTIKGRPLGKGMTVLLPSLEAAGEYVELSPNVKTLVQRYWPGALNVVAPAAARTPLSPLCATNGTHAVRLSSHPVAAALARRLGKPLVSTSANLAGKPDLYTVREIFDAFFGQPAMPDALIDAGDLPRTPPSTVIKVDRDGIRVLRQGRVVVWE